MRVSRYSHTLENMFFTKFSSAARPRQTAPNPCLLVETHLDLRQEEQSSAKLEAQENSSEVQVAKPLPCAQVKPSLESVRWDLYCGFQSRFLALQVVGSCH